MDIDSAPYQEYPEFIAETLSKFVRYTCNPELLAGKPGAAPDAPSHMALVSFRPKVLEKYKGDPERYSIGGGRLREGIKWDLPLWENEDPIRVSLGDLGVCLPAEERHHWRNFMIEP
ncbi:MULTISPECIES: hypothetical protein [Arthrobacter]|uniref:Uncharacterized protein n=1 Tax=Arthrobacter terricola TaxID=2547396 RepID=A0A4R5K6E7_9MICC|nr:MULTISPECIES: hypothetical protein [Arthrobacter]MBT8163483.1 hypothetical protein [Arthrobacter sp. GN70]TDF89471.1 hypothetical protein E1809_22960 [Arthrobacter terricola]